MKERCYLSRKGPEGETLFPVDGPIFIGSRDCDVAVKDAAPRHCQIVRTSEGFVAIDLTGQKLIRVNGARTERHLLREGEVLAVGSTEFRWTVVLEAEQETPAEPPRKATRRREKTPAPMAAPTPRNKTNRLICFAAVAAAAVVLIAVLVFAFTSSKPSNMDRNTVRREIRPTPSEPRTPSPGVVPEVIAKPTAVTPESRRDPGGVVEAPPPIVADPVRTFEPAPILVAGADRAPVTPAVPVTPAKAPSPSAARYVALIRNLEQTLARGTGLEAVHRELLEASAGAPRETADLLRTLAASLKAAVLCGDCTSGRVTCAQCDGKGRIDLECPTCQGRGRVRASGAVGDAQVSVKCRNCEGKKIFRGVTCPGCSRVGKTVCTSCKGQAWPGDRCPRTDCKSGRVACPQCSGRGVEFLPCPSGCVRGRVRAPGAVDNADVTMKCRDCEVNGQTGNGTLKADCKLCSKTGKVTCDSCGGPFAKKTDAQRASIPASKVFSSERCGDCSGSGCDGCLGLGLRIRPVTN